MNGGDFLRNMCEGWFAVPISVVVVSGGGTEIGFGIQKNQFSSPSCKQKNKNGQTNVSSNGGRTIYFEDINAKLSRNGSVAGGDSLVCFLLTLRPGFQWFLNCLFRRARRNGFPHPPEKLFNVHAQFIRLHPAVLYRNRKGLRSKVLSTKHLPGVVRCRWHKCHRRPMPGNRLRSSCYNWL